MDLQVLQQREDKYLFDMKALIDAATTDSRALTDAEKKSYADWETGLADVGKQIAKVKGDQSFFSQLDRITGGDGTRTSKDGRIIVSRANAIKTFGQQYVESEAFAWHAKERANRPAQWTSPSVELPREALARFAALTEDPASGGALVVPDYQRTIQPGPIMPIVVADLLAPGTTNSNVVPTMVEKAYTNAAAPVLEGGVKPESTLTFEPRTEPVRKIAHWMPITEELLEDAPAVASYVDARLRYGVMRKEDQQLLFGTGVAPELQGILARTGLAPSVTRVDPATNADAILAQIVAIESTTGLPVSGIVMNPLAWAAIIGTKLTTGEYLTGGPFGSPTAPMLWNRQVALTDQMPAAEALVGAFRNGAQVFRHGGIRVNSSNSHASYFIENKVAIRAEERLALAVYRAAAFGRVLALTVVVVA